MRQRTVKAEPLPEPEKRPSPFIASVDFFVKPKEDYQKEQSRFGNIVSIVSIALIVSVVIVEIFGYVTGKDAYSTDLSIDREMSVDMPINLNIDFPRISCNQLSVDLLDISGTQRFNLTLEIAKTPLSQVKTFSHRGNAGFGGRYPNKLPHNPSSPMLDQKGCRVEGTILTRKVSGLIMFGPKRSDGRYMMLDILKFDAAHKINRFNFGNSSVERFSRKGIVQPLEGREYASEQFSKIKYFLKVVPTTYSLVKAKKKATTFEYSAQISQQAVGVGMGGAVPGVYIQFDPYPIQIDNVFQRPPLAHFLVKVCALVGGIFVVMGLFDTLVAFYMP